jgi:hypothetical protein
VSGTRGHLWIDDFVLPHFGSELTFEVSNAVYDVNGCDFNMEPHRRRYSVAEYANSRAQAQETNMIRRFSANVLAEAIEPFWGEIALKTQHVLDACLQSSRADGQRVPLTARPGTTSPANGPSVVIRST